jgi:hypothetical protein
LEVEQDKSDISRTHPAFFSFLYKTLLEKEINLKKERAVPSPFLMEDDYFSISILTFLVLVADILGM